MNKLVTGFTNLDLWGFHITINVMGTFLILISILAMYFFYKGQKADNTFNVYDFFMEGGKASVSRLAFFGSWVLTSWIIADREIKGILDLTFYAAYLAAWVGPLVTRYIVTKVQSTGGG